MLRKIVSCTQLSVYAYDGARRIFTECASALSFRAYSATASCVFQVFHREEASPLKKQW